MGYCLKIQESFSKIQDMTKYWKNVSYIQNGKWEQIRKKELENKILEKDEKELNKAEKMILKGLEEKIVGKKQWLGKLGEEIEEEWKDKNMFP